MKIGCSVMIVKDLFFLAESPHLRASTKLQSEFPLNVSTSAVS